MPKTAKTKPAKQLRGGTEAGPVPATRTRRSRSKSERLAREAQKLLSAAPTDALKADISQGRTVYPAHLMRLSKCGTLDADPATMHNYNPIGERGERRYLPLQNRREEDHIDGLPPSDAKRESEGWPSSCGTVVNAGSVLRDAMRLNRMR